MVKLELNSIRESDRLVPNMYMFTSVSGGQHILFVIELPHGA